jgi:dolichyl-phosphate-mannose--protein O-mannosyl transferase
MMLGLFTGLILICATVLTYMMIWREREERGAEPMEPEPEQESLVRWYFGFMPWILQMTFLFSLLFAILYVILTLVIPPNW